MKSRYPYTAELNRPHKRFAICLLVPAFTSFVLLFLLAAVLALVFGNRMPLGPILGSVGIFGILGFASGWLLIRLLRESDTNDEQTTMPIWFIQAFGWFFASGLILSALHFGNIWMSLEGLFIAIAMIRIRSLLAVRTCPSDDLDFGEDNPVLALSLVSDDGVDVCRADEVKTEAEAIAIALEMGFIVVADAVLWADSQVAATECADSLICDVAVSAARQPQAVASLLRQLPGNCNHFHAVRQSLFLALNGMVDGRLDPVDVANGLSRLASKGRFPKGEFETLAFRFCDDLDFAHKGLGDNTVSQVVGDMKKAMTSFLK